MKQLQRIVVLGILAGLGCGERHKSYMRHPLIREMKVTAGETADTETSTQAEPYPPPRPVLPNDPAHVAVAWPGHLP